MINKEGQGWRIIRDSSRNNFSTLIGGEYWAIELNQNEWDTLVKAVNNLSDQYQDIKVQLMDDEDITLEMELNPWLGILKGDKNGWNLKLILNSSDSLIRGAEVYWPSNVTCQLANAVKTMSNIEYF